MLLSYKSIACAVYLRELIIFISMFHIVAINHFKTIESIDKQPLQEHDGRKIQTKLQVVYPLYF